jgi:hypothetical protein
MRMKWAGHVAKIGEKRNAYGVSLVKSERKRPLGVSRHTFGYNIELEFIEIGRVGMD